MSADNKVTVSIQKILVRVRNFWRIRLWQPEILQGGAWRPWAIIPLRVLAIAVEGFSTERLKHQAATLTYVSLLALVPLLAVAFSVFAGFGGLERVEDQLKDLVYSYIAAGDRETVINYLEQFVGQVNAGALGGVGVAFLFLIVASLLGTIEHALNEIWGVRRSRTLSQKFVTYWGLVTVSPILLGVSLTITASLQSSTVVAWLLEYLPYGRQLFSMVPIVFTWFAFTLLYVIMPNTRVRLKYALAGGVVAGTLWEIAKWGYAVYTAQAITYNAIYGSLSAIPFFMIWLYLSWSIVLIGAQISFASQSLRSHTRSLDDHQVSQAFRELLGARLVLAIGRRFDMGGSPPTAEDLGTHVGAPVKLVRQLLRSLEENGILREAMVDGLFTYVPALPLDRQTLWSVVEVLRTRVGTTPPLGEDSTLRAIQERLTKARDCEKEILESETLREI